MARHAAALLRPREKTAIDVRLAAGVDNCADEIGNSVHTRHIRREFIRAGVVDPREMGAPRGRRPRRVG
jgi:hypothetical protein